MPYDASLRPETTYLPFNTINPGYGPIDIRVADNYTGNQPSQVCQAHSFMAQLSIVPSSITKAVHGVPPTGNSCLTLLSAVSPPALHVDYSRLAAEIPLSNLIQTAYAALHFLHCPAPLFREGN